MEDKLCWILLHSCQNFLHLKTFKLKFITIGWREITLYTQYSKTSKFVFSNRMWWQAIAFWIGILLLPIFEHGSLFSHRILLCRKMIKYNIKNSFILFRVQCEMWMVKQELFYSTNKKKMKTKQNVKSCY